MLEDYLTDGNEISSVLSRADIRALLPTNIDDNMADRLFSELSNSRQERLDKIIAEIKDSFDLEKASNSIDTSTVAKETVERVLKSLDKAKRIVETQVNYVQEDIAQEVLLLRRLAQRAGDGADNFNADLKLYELLTSLERSLGDGRENQNINS